LITEPTIRTAKRWHRELDPGHGNFTYCYDAESRLITAVSGGTCPSPITTVATYGYDAQGRRKSKTVGSAITITLTDSANHALLDYDGSSGAILRWYAVGPNDLATQSNVAAGTRTTPLPDIQGSIVATLDSRSGALTKIGYLAFGESPAGLPVNFGYTGQQIDVETNGLYYFRARQYSPLLGRFMQADPIGYQGGLHLSTRMWGMIRSMPSIRVACQRMVRPFTRHLVRLER
jgi:RHS repeat-associated protein